MKTVLTNLGSRGDVQPLFALAFALRARGHSATLLVAPQYKNDVEHLGFDFRPLGLDLDYRHLQQRDTDSELAGVDPLAMMKRSLHLMEFMLPVMFEQAVDACKNNDVLISGHLQPIARMMHELVAIPFVSLHTNHFGGLQPKPFRDASCAVINPFRRLHGLEQLSDPLHTEAHSPQLALHVISRHLRTPTSRFPTHHHVTGFFFLDETGWTPDESLRDFLESGPPPLAISFSSMVHRDPSAMTNLLLQATEELGCRAIIQSGWSGLAESTSLPPHVFATGYVPHTWLFSSASCIIHAGGAGTTAAALWSGVPAVIVPHLIDQPLWAELVQGLGCARSIIHLRDLTVDALSQGIRATLDDPDLLSNSKSFGKKIRAEQGVDRACDLIEKTMREIGIIE